MQQKTTDAFVAHAIKSTSQLKDPTTTRWCLLSGGLKRWTLEYNIKGKERVVSPGDTSTLLEAGSLLLISPGTPRNHGQDFECKKWVRYFCTFVPRTRWETKLLDWPEIYPGAMRLVVPKKLQGTIAPLFDQCAAVCRTAWELRHEMLMNLLEQILLWCHTINPKNKQASMDERVVRAMHFIAEHFARDLDIPEVASHVGLSRAHFTRLFHRESGISPRRYIESCRIEEAQHLLQNNTLTAAEVAYACGFEDPARFSNVFKARTGRSPSTVRPPTAPGARTARTKKRNPGP
jgi:AraC-like DNA-binding protein